MDPIKIRFTASNKMRRVVAGKELLISQTKMLNDSGDDENRFSKKKRMMMICTYSRAHVAECDTCPVLNVGKQLLKPARHFHILEIPQAPGKNHIEDDEDAHTEEL